MRIGINASFIRKPHTGIGQVSVNFLKKLIQLQSLSMADKFQNNLEFVLYLEDDLPKDIRLPKNFTKQIFLPWWKRDDLVRKILWEKFYLPKKVIKDKCDILLSLYQSPTIVAPNIKHIMLAHDIIPKLFPEYLDNLRKKHYWRLIEKAFQRADKILAVSARTEKDLIQHLGLDAKKISVNYIDCDEIYKKNVETRHASSVLKKYKLKPGYIYTGGGLEVRKNTEGTIRAYKYLLERNLREHFLIDFPKLVISGKLLPQLAPLVTDVEKLIKELNLTQYVKILGFVPQEDLPVIYKNAAVFVYPSCYEGFGIPVLEAMSVGTATATSKKSSLPEVGLDSVLYCNPDDIQDIAMVIKNILLNDELRNTLARRGQERAQYFSWERFVIKTMNIIEDVYKK